MASPSKEASIQQLILENSPLKEWRFKDFVKEAKVTKAVANKWLGKYVQKGLLTKVKKPGSFPFFTVGKMNLEYISLKRVHAIEQLHSCGLTPTLLALPEAKTIILFGSYARGDWYQDSDIDLFVLGDLGEFDKTPYEITLKKPIELHIFQTTQELREVTTGLIRNILNGYVIKGSIRELIEEAT